MNANVNILNGTHTNHHLHPKVHDGAIVVRKVQTVSFELLKVSESICKEIKSGNVHLVFAINILLYIRFAQKYSLNNNKKIKKNHALQLEISFYATV